MNTKITKFIFETNTQPGLTSISLLPEQAKFKKISFEKIVMNIIENTINNKNINRRTFVYFTF